MIRNVVFDMGGVLIQFDPEEFMTREGILDPADRKIIREEVFRSVEWAQMDLGVMTEETMAPRVRARVPEHLKEKAVYLLRNWCYPRKMIPGMESLVRRLKKGGYGIYLLSNASVNQPTYWNALPVSSQFDGTLVSAFVKVVKPNPVIYRLFTEEFHLREEECVFIDDAPINVAAAIACGWQGIVFHGDADQAERKLREMGLMFPEKDA